jgi:hypothetical protein
MDPAALFGKTLDLPMSDRSAVKKNRLFIITRLVGN